MTPKDFRDAKQSLYALAMALGQNGVQQEELRIALQQIERIGQNDKVTLLGMIGVLYDGLAYGNWPWALKELKK